MESKQNATEPRKIWLEKFNENRTSIYMLTIMGLLIVSISSWSMISLREKTEHAWSILGSVAAVTEVDPSISPDLKVVDLYSKSKTFVLETVGSLDALPTRMRTQLAQTSPDVFSLEDLPLIYLPEMVQKMAIRLHFIEQLEEQLPLVQNTSAAPWMYYSLGNLYFQDGKVDKAIENYKNLQSQFPQHPLSSKVDVDITKAEKEIVWESKNALSTKWNKVEPGINSAKVEFSTSKGKFSVNLIEGLDSKVEEHFLSLVQNDFYNGLIFYRAEDDRVYSGCPLGNGKGKPEEMIEAPAKDLLIQRGFLVLDAEEGSDEVGSRFYIQKRCSFNNTLDKVVILGIVDDISMATVEQLGNFDVLLDASVLGQPDA